jgi:hypothetical protein
MLKGGLKTAYNKSLKKSYKGLNKEQYKIIKLKEKKDIAEKYLYGTYGFYSKAKRLTTGQVDFDSMDDRTMQVFEQANKDINKFNSLDCKEVDNAVNIFKQTQFQFSQSF